MDLKILFSRAHKNIRIPTRSKFKPGYELFIDMDWFQEKYASIVVLKHGQSIRLSTGIRSSFSKEYYIKIEEKYSTGLISLKKNAGIIDSDYRDIWNILVVNTSNKRLILCNNKTYEKLIEDENYAEHNVIYNIEKESLFQFLIHKIPQTTLEEVDEKYLISGKSEKISSLKKLIKKIF